MNGSFTMQYKIWTRSLTVRLHFVSTALQHVIRIGEREDNDNNAYTRCTRSRNGKNHRSRCCSRLLSSVSSSSATPVSIGVSQLGLVVTNSFRATEQLQDLRDGPALVRCIHREAAAGLEARA